ncbi:hypothetical protein EK904_002328 [Melospiza melodia maxima]|nr:hypothetical protein EK904_002328 [Melospiza melodia maxima]
MMRRGDKEQCTLAGNTTAQEYSTDNHLQTWTSMIYTPTIMTLREFFSTTSLYNVSSLSPNKQRAFTLMHCKVDQAQRKSNSVPIHMQPSLVQSTAADDESWAAVGGRRVSDAVLFGEPMPMNCATQRAREMGSRQASSGQHGRLISRNRSLKKQTGNLRSFGNSTKFTLRALLGKVVMRHSTQGGYGQVSSKHSSTVGMNAMKRRREERAAIPPSTCGLLFSVLAMLTEDILLLKFQLSLKTLTHIYFADRVSLKNEFRWQLNERLGSISVCGFSSVTFPASRTGNSGNYSFYLTTLNKGGKYVFQGIEKKKSEIWKSYLNQNVQKPLKTYTSWRPRLNPELSCIRVYEQKNSARFFATYKHVQFCPLLCQSQGEFQTAKALVTGLKEEEEVNSWGKSSFPVYPQLVSEMEQNNTTSGTISQSWLKLQP